MADQMFASKGLRPKTNYVDVINARTPYLPEKYRQIKNDEVQQQEFQFNQNMFDQQTSLEKKKMQKTQDNTNIANMLGIGKLGLDSYLAYETANNAAKPGQTSNLSNILNSVIPGMGKESGGNENLVTATVNKVGDTSNWISGLGDSFKSGGDASGILGSELIGESADEGTNLLGDAVKKGGDLLGGAGDWLGGLYDSAVGSLFGDSGGGGGGWFSFF